MPAVMRDAAQSPRYTKLCSWTAYQIPRRKALEHTYDRINEVLLNLGDEGEDKVTTLEGAIAQNVHPGMTLHLGGEPSAALRQIIRQFWGRNPRFTIVSSTMTRPYATDLIYHGMASKTITSAYDYGPRAYPSGFATATALRQGSQNENWSLYSIEQRLMAGALGVGFMPTKSILGSDMQKENEDSNSFQVIVDPFERSRKEAIVRAIVPDLSIVHGCVADRYGNTILPLPWADAIWGPRAAKDGVVVTVEKVVSTDFIREHSSLVKLPGYLVKSVCPAPMGAHPHGLVNPRVRNFEGYETDWDFFEDHAEATRTPESFDAWTKQWILGCATHQDYLEKLGHQRITLLRERAVPDAWKANLAYASAAIEEDQQYSASDMMLIAAAREIERKAVKHGYRTILSGVGTGGLAACLAYLWLRKRGYGIDLLWGLGRIGYAPSLGQNNPLSVCHTLTSKALTDITEIYGVVVGGQNAKCISVLGALQIDRFGNIDNSRTGGLGRSNGVGGAGDAINADETIVVVKHSPDRIVEKVTYVGCPGDRVKTLVSSMGIFKKVGDDKEFTLSACFPDARSQTLQDRVRMIRETCGWDLKIAVDLREIASPTKDELTLLRLLGLQRSLAGD
jgi:acyl CoA:acetate/3-ketoacid CoA transferase alpha subunit